MNKIELTFCVIGVYLLMSSVFNSFQENYKLAWINFILSSGAFVAAILTYNWN